MTTISCTSLRCSADVIALSIEYLLSDRSWHVKGRDISILYLLFNIEDTMSDLRSLALSNTALLEKYLLANDPKDFLAKEVTLPQDSHFFSLLLDQPSEKDEEYMKNLGLSQRAKKELSMAKLWREARTITTPEGKQQLLKKLKEMHPEVRFDFPQPA